jgi:serine/threonine-protein kinase
MMMVYVPPGTFPMGSTDGEDDERPVHDVALDGFWIDETEVTNAQHTQCVDAGECAASSYADDPTYNGDDYPVVGVSWNEADTYCRWAGGQLPAEAQWEYAARGPEGNRYPWGEEFEGKLVNYCDENCTYDWKDESFNDGYELTAPVGSYPEGASWVGALDMAGNVWEWVNDWYDGDYYANSPAENPAGPESGAAKVLRGGSWYSRSIYLRGAYRNNEDLVFRDAGFGFRCVLPGG